MRVVWKGEVRMILDACCGGKTMYHGWDKNLGDQLISIDIRALPVRDWIGGEGYKAKMAPIEPTIKADINWLPFKEQIFDAIIFDPPHLQTDIRSFMGEKYGAWAKSQAYKNMVAVNTEFARVLKPKGLLLMKVLALDARTYISLLSNFIFFLPIEYNSQSNLSNVKVGWYIGMLKSSLPTSSSAHDRHIPAYPTQQELGLPLHLRPSESS